MRDGRMYDLLLGIVGALVSIGVPALVLLALHTYAPKEKDDWLRTHLRNQLENSIIDTTKRKEHA